MRLLGIDYGEKRVGLAYADELGVAVPLPALVQSRAQERLHALKGIVGERRIEALVVGYPYNMDGSVGFKAREVDAFIAELERELGLPVHRSDERLTSAAARTRGGKRKTVRQQRQERASGVLDSRAATLILQDFLETTPQRRPEDG